MFESRLAKQKWDELNEACDESRDRVPCQSTDFDIWFPDENEHGKMKMAKRFCGKCPVQMLCLEYALLNNEQSGVWGGTSPRQRKEMRSKRRI